MNTRTSALSYVPPLLLLIIGGNRNLPTSPLSRSFPVEVFVVETFVVEVLAVEVLAVKILAVEVIYYLPMTNVPLMRFLVEQTSEIGGGHSYSGIVEVNLATCRCVPV